MNIGKLYQAKNYHWMLYPSKDIAIKAVVKKRASSIVHVTTVANLTDYWSRYFSCNISAVKPKSIFVFLEQDKNFCKVLTTNGELGWIHIEEWCKSDIEEVNQELKSIGYFNV